MLALAAVEGVSELSVLTGDECRAAAGEVLALEGRWTRRNPDLPIYTLGTASYLDAASGRAAEYRATARATNALLAERFGWIHERLLAALAEELGAPTFFHDDFALPGFHVFTFHESFTRPLASVHFDLQHQLVHFARVGDPDRHLSLTLAIRLPACGAGLRLWPVHWEQLEGLPEEERTVRLVGLEPAYHPYTAGRLVLHSGHQLHQIAPAPGLRPEDVRITMQAHAARVRGRWLVYW